MDELHVTSHTKLVPACPSGRHVVHPLVECDEIDLLSAAFAEMYEAALTQSIDGNGTGASLGILATHSSREPTPMDRALDILDPELRRCPLYDA
ncbi:hypothetical protein AB0912_15465 [Streptomyces sp. NPDC007084]|uniref:hypothetical protein n=1 Tax=Streptomyces sp. NPDC007084 TaxID=3154313 RepID=UPI003457090F